MSKQALISMPSIWAHRIMNKEQTLLLRSFNLGDYVGWVNVYVSKRKPIFVTAQKDGKVIQMIDGWEKEFEKEYGINGKVAFRFWCDCYEKLDYDHTSDYWGEVDGDPLFCVQDVCKKACVDEDYLMDCDCDDITLYAWNVGNVEVFDRSKELNQFFREHMPVKSAPKSDKVTWVFVDE